MKTEHLETPPPTPPPPLLRQLLPVGLFLLAALLVAAFLQWRCFGVTDRDAYYHFRQAAEYLRRGLFSPASPFSHGAIARAHADIWYGFHIFLLPFTRFRDPIFGLQAAAVGELTLALALLYLAVRRLRLPYPWLWPFLAVLFSPTSAHILIKARPHVLSAGLAPLLLSLLVTGPAWSVLLVSAALTWLHPSFLWVIPLLAGLVFLVKGLVERAWEWQGAAASLAGLAVGLLLRPNPIAAAKLQYLQLVTLQLVRRQHLPIDFGAELDPLSWSRFANQFLLAPVLWVLAAAVCLFVLLRRVDLPPRTRTVLWCTLLCAAVFAAMALEMTYRAVPLWAAFTSLSLAAIFGALVLSPDARGARWYPADLRLLLAAALPIFIAIQGWQLVDSYVLKSEWTAAPSDYMQGPGTWLREHSRPGDVVANIGWHTFPQLYFWSPENRYLYGMDPIFLYAEDPRFFWKVRHLNDGATDYTSDAPVLPNGARVDTYTFLSKEVGARYVFVQRSLLPALDVYLASDPRYAPRYTDQFLALYEVLPASGAGPSRGA